MGQHMSESYFLNNEDLCSLLGEATGCDKIAFYEVASAMNEPPSFFARGKETLSDSFKLSETEILSIVADAYGVKRSDVVLEKAPDEPASSTASPSLPKGVNVFAAVSRRPDLI